MIKNTKNYVGLLIKIFNCCTNKFIKWRLEVKSLLKCQVAGLKA